MAIRSTLKRLVVRGAMLAASQAEEVERDGRTVEIGDNLGLLLLQ